MKINYFLSSKTLQKSLASLLCVSFLSVFSHTIVHNFVHSENKHENVRENTIHNTEGGYETHHHHHHHHEEEDTSSKQNCAICTAFASNRFAVFGNINIGFALDAQGYLSNHLSFIPIDSEFDLYSLRAPPRTFLLI